MTRWEAKFSMIKIYLSLELDKGGLSLTYYAICYTIRIVYMYFFFLDELRKFTISDFPKQMHLGYTLITLFFY